MLSTGPPIRSWGRRCNILVSLVTVPSKTGRGPEQRVREVEAEIASAQGAGRRLGAARPKGSTEPLYSELPLPSAALAVQSTGRATAGAWLVPGPGRGRGAWWRWFEHPGPGPTLDPVVPGPRPMSHNATDLVLVGPAQAAAGELGQLGAHRAQGRPESVGPTATTVADKDPESPPTSAAPPVHRREPAADGGRGRRTGCGSRRAQVAVKHLVAWCRSCSATSRRLGSGSALSQKRPGKAPFQGCLSPPLRPDVHLLGPSTNWSPPPVARRVTATAPWLRHPGHGLHRRRRHATNPREQLLYNQPARAHRVHLRHLCQGRQAAVLDVVDGVHDVSDGGLAHRLVDGGEKRDRAPGARAVVGYEETVWRGRVQGAPARRQRRWSP